MSTYEEDEALFEDIYGDDKEEKVKNTSEEAKEKEEKNEKIASNNGNNQIEATNEETSKPGEEGISNTNEQMTGSGVMGSELGNVDVNSLGKENGKMFIGGLNWDTTEEGLVKYFSNFGEVIDHTIMRDNNTGKSRGFGFLTFKDSKSVDDVIKTDHILDGKLIDPKRAISREEQDKVGKIFVGGIDPMVNEKDFNDFFSQFGNIIDAQLMIDKDTGRSRGFGFITYDSPDAVDRVTVNKYLTLKGKAMEVKRAEPRGQHQQNQLMQQQSAQFNNFNTYGSHFNQMQYQQPAMHAYNPGMNMTNEIMHEYWQRMQQWYMYQHQAVQAHQTGAMTYTQEQSPMNQDSQQVSPQAPPVSEPPAQPLNPQQQATEFPDENKSEDLNSKSKSNPVESDSGLVKNSVNKDSRRLNLPKGPRRTPPTGPSGSSRNRSSYNRSRGYHPYRRGGRK